MMGRRIVTIACPNCGSRLPSNASWPGLLDCPACGSPLIVMAREQSARSVIDPLVERADAVALALSSWRHPLAPPGFPGRPEPPRLLFVACFEVERTLTRENGFVTETLGRALATFPEGYGIENLDVDAALNAPRRPYDPGEIQQRGLVFGAARYVATALPPPPGLDVREERLEIVLTPVWLVRCRHRGDRYEAAVDAVSGRLLRSRAPVARGARLGQSVALLYPVAAILGAIRFSRLTVEIAIRMNPVIWIWIAGGLFLLLAWAWDRVRFRYEWVVAGEQGRLEPLNRPDATLLDRVVRLFFSVRPRGRARP
ncbi:MAG: zinc ribbon domain-containing protein [Vicinamibacteria bacterium]|jgi:DNA-directed RNA polymerase subunit RPC12/RpoP|nr:zinc ribbon domain-containing protein [Vicinamibacteria bacterium]